MKTHKVRWQFWVMSLVLALPMSAIVIYGQWSITDLPWHYWAYLVAAGLSLSYFQLRYFDKS